MGWLGFVLAAATGLLLLAAGALILLLRLWRHRPAPAADASRPLVTYRLAGVATAALPATFHLEGLVNSGPLRWRSGEFTTLDFHLDPERLTFRFTEGAYFDLGGIRRVPASLDLTLYPEGVRRSAMDAPAATTIDLFYAGGRASHWFEDRAWKRDEAYGDERIRLLEAPDLAQPQCQPARLLQWLDRRRGVRLDFFTWQARRSEAETVALLRALGAGVERHAAALSAHFRAIPEFPARLAALRARQRSALEQALAPHGLARAPAGTAHWGPAGGVLWSEDGRRVAVLRALGVAAASRIPPAPFTLSLLAQDAEGLWRAYGAHDRRRYPEPLPALVTAFAARCALQRTHWFWYREYDLEAVHEPLDLAERLGQCADWARERAGEAGALAAS